MRMEVHIVTLSIQRWCLAYFRSFLLKIFLDLLIHGDYNEHVFYELWLAHNSFSLSNHFISYFHH